MKFSSSLAISAVSFITSVAAYAVTGGSVAINKEPVFQVDPNSKDSQRVTLDAATDVVSLAVSLQAGRQPHQLMYLLSDNNGLDHAVFAEYSDGSASADVSVNKLPSALKRSERIFVSLIAADAREDEANVNFPVVEFLPSQVLKDSVSSKSPERLGAKPEIHHIFRSDPSTINGVVPVVFSGLAVALFVVLLGAWATFLKDDLFGSTQGSTMKAALLSTLAIFEYTFFKYYLGASIFTTVFQSLLLAGPFLFFGSRALSSLARSRAQKA